MVLHLEVDPAGLVFLAGQLLVDFGLQLLHLGSQLALRKALEEPGGGGPGLLAGLLLVQGVVGGLLEVAVGQHELGVVGVGAAGVFVQQAGVLVDRCLVILGVEVALPQVEGGLGRQPGAWIVVDHVPEALHGVDVLPALEMLLGPGEHGVRGG